ncbi:MAG TPA: prolipoprotein diacylglyceryl transferase family protein [Pirellulaceae bacterium]|nr:prolipoprotein diacylglyceryl transferase family protein [Pirellulaceae bacterium]
MLQTLFHIPHAIGPLPVFGLGWALIVWLLICATWLVMMLARGEKASDIQSSLLLMGMVALALAFVLPRIEEQAIDPTNPAIQVPVGVPIRGYGTLLLVAIVAGVGLAAYRARRMGLDPEIILSLAFWMLFSGIFGARLFFVIQKWDQFLRPTIQETLFALFDFVGGGLVVFGSAIGALAALVVFCRVRKLPTLAIADLVAPSMMVGLAIGRIGCLMNGCCYGGVCEIPQLALQFPPEAPAYQDQLVSGMLFGFHLKAEKQPDSDREQVVVDWVQPGSAAEREGLKVGDRIAGILGSGVDSLQSAQQVLVEMPRYLVQNSNNAEPQDFSLIRADGTVVAWPIASVPPRSLPIHPTQIYSSIDAALLALLLWYFYPFRRRDGEVVALMLTLHPISRFWLEVIRTDEDGALGTPFTISQLVGFLFLAAAVALWIWIERQPRGSALPIQRPA